MPDSTKIETWQKPFQYKISTTLPPSEHGLEQLLELFGLIVDSVNGMPRCTGLDQSSIVLEKRRNLSKSAAAMVGPSYF
jgi:hypothetical protein